MSRTTSPTAQTSARPRRSLRRSKWAGVVVAVVSTTVVVGIVGWLMVNSVGWPRFQKTFFNQQVFEASWDNIAQAFLLNLRIFFVSLILILVFALLLAILRGLRDPVFFPVRAFAVVYVDFFRGVPSVLVIYLLGLGMPALRLPGLPNEAIVWGIASLVLVWTAYVSEVYRAGIESIHPSQDAAARSLGLSGRQSMRYVVLPQAVRRVIPPLMNDAIGLTKDTALVAFIGPIEAFRRAQIESAATFNFTPYVVSAVLFLLLTIPMARATDWLVKRDRERSQAGAR